MRVNKTYQDKPQVSNIISMRLIVLDLNEELFSMSVSYLPDGELIPLEIDVSIDKNDKPKRVVRKVLKAIQEKHNVPE